MTKIKHNKHVYKLTINQDGTATINGERCTHYFSNLHTATIFIYMTGGRR